MSDGPVFFGSAAELRQWLLSRHGSAAELLVGFFRKAARRQGLTYQEALDEALCFGWIDGVRRRVDGERYAIRFTPRKSRSIWSAVNLKRAAELEAAGRMTAPGLATLSARDPRRSGVYSYERQHCEFDAACLGRFKRHAGAWRFFEAQPPSYRRVACWYVMSAKKDETRRRRLDRLIADSAAGRRLGPTAPQKATGR
jgi:uncharacterized protein YdeI (YjbR/CyaY-like superfamily)